MFWEAIDAGKKIVIFKTIGIHFCDGALWSF